MPKAIFVIGANATGKTCFIENNFKGKAVLNVYDYQQRAYDEAGFGQMIPFSAQFRCLMQANEKILEDIIKTLKRGEDVVVEHTLFKAKRRIAYFDEIRKIPNVSVEVYLMRPGDACWEDYLKKRELKGSFQHHKKTADEIEFPNAAEGIDRIYEVIDGEIIERTEPPNSDIPKAARKELEEEARRIHAEDEERKRRKELLDSMKTRPFWHHCEVCGKKEFITAKEAFDSGWDYPPDMGHFGLLGPRTCGKCQLKDTLFWKINANGRLPIVCEEELSAEELVTWRRIKGEPESLLHEEGR